MEISEIVSVIDHTLLKATATGEQIIECCEQAKVNKFASVCVNPCYVRLVSNELKGTDVKVCTVIGFPLGANLTDVKVYEAQRAIIDGADEVDMVINIGALKGGDYDYVESDIASVVNATNGKALVKVIIEACYLSDVEKEIACKLAEKAGAHFVKTSTGFGSGGATAEDVSLMSKAIGPNMKIKASGNVKTLEDAVNMVRAGADRIGTSSGISIMKEINWK